MYKVPVELKHNESLLKVDKETGEISEISKRTNNIPEGKELFDNKETFLKYHPNVWKFLKKYLSHLEISATIGIVNLANIGSNSLSPINDDTPLKYLEEELGISKNKIKTVLDKLFKIGVYGKFEVYDPSKPYTKYWLVNPYLIFSGNLIQSDIKNLFNGTHIARAYRDELYFPSRL